VTRIVLDTNVLISSFFGGNPRKIVDLWKSGEITLCLSKPIIEEYVDVLQRLGLENEPEFGELLKIFARGHHILFTAKTPELHVVPQDPADDRFIECALALKAQYIVTGDKALRDIGEYMGTKVLTPKEFLKDR
jgi:uncharacterized protein